MGLLRSLFLLAAVVGVTIISLPEHVLNFDVDVRGVFFYGWMTAVATGAGALPFMFVREPSRTLLGIANAVAAGMMISASVGLIVQGCIPQREGQSFLVSSFHTALGALIGLAFIRVTTHFLDQHEDISIGKLDALDARRILLVVVVMSLHSFSEGVGIGVSFGGADGSRLGVLISLSLAVHNVPEGLAVALVMQPRGVTTLDAALWCIFTSLPQPVMAVPAFLFVQHFEPFLPVGMGFAAGAMLHVAILELLADALKELRLDLAMSTTGTSFAVMCLIQFLINDSTLN